MAHMKDPNGTKAAGPARSPGGMTFADMSQRAESHTRKFIDAISDGAPEPVAKMVEVLDYKNTHTFMLGYDAEVRENLGAINEDILSDMEVKIPMPFKDTTVASIVEGGGDLKSGWVFDRMIEFNDIRRDNTKLPPEVPPEISQRTPQSFHMIRYDEHFEMPLVWSYAYYGWWVAKRAFVFGIEVMMQDAFAHAFGMKHLTDPEVFRTQMTEYWKREAAPIIKQVAMISHPMNYIVRVTPALTDREKRRVAAGKSTSSSKRPHFIVVDHQGLREMSPDKGGTHASPIPHHRRGHWRRLSDRCREAKAAGKGRAWVRPTYIGDLTFADPKNNYEVLMDFGASKPW